jgi:hypothetical protein
MATMVAPGVDPGERHRVTQRLEVEGSGIEGAAASHVAECHITGSHEGSDGDAGEDPADAEDCPPGEEEEVEPCRRHADCPEQRYHRHHEGGTGERRRGERTQLELSRADFAHRAAHELVWLEQQPPAKHERQRREEPAEMAAGVITDGGPAVDPADGPDDGVQQNDDEEPGERQGERVPAKQ